MWCFTTRIDLTQDVFSLTVGFVYAAVWCIRFLPNVIRVREFHSARRMSIGS